MAKKLTEEQIPMLQNEEGVHKLREFIKNKFPNMSENEIEKMALNLYELGLLVVRINIKNSKK